MSEKSLPSRSMCQKLKLDSGPHGVQLLEGRSSSPVTMFWHVSANAHVVKCGFAEGYLLGTSPGDPSCHFDTVFEAPGDEDSSI